MIFVKYFVEKIGVFLDFLDGALFSQNGCAITTSVRAIAKALRIFLGFCDTTCKRTQISPIMA